MTEQPETQDVTSDDRLWVLLAYILSPIVPIIILFMEDKKNRPYIRAHNAQALIMGLILVLLSIVLGASIVLVVLECIPFLLWLLMVYWGIQAYQGKYVTIPVITDWCHKQGWS